MPNEYRILPDTPSINNPGTCNNNACPKPKIYWNPAVRNRETGKQIPLNEPFDVMGVREPSVHRCLRQYRPGKYINKTNDSFLEQISYSKELYDFLKKIHWTYQNYNPKLIN